MPENTSYDLDRIPEQVEDIRYCIMNCQDKKDIDFFFMPLIFLESFFAHCIVLQLGKHHVRMPIDWSIIICDEAYSELDVMPLSKLNDRGFHTPVFNPLNHFISEPEEIIMTDVFAEIKWFFPKLQNGNILVVPLEDGPKPKCALFVKEGNKIPTPMDVAELFQ